MVLRVSPRSLSGSVLLLVLALVAAASSLPAGAAATATATLHPAAATHQQQPRRHHHDHQQAGPFNLLDFGAVPGVDTNEAAKANAQAIIQAFAAASAKKRQASAADQEHFEARWDAVLDHSRASYDESAPMADHHRRRLFLLDESVDAVVSASASTVLVPAGQEFYIAYTPIVGASHVLLQINGTLIISGNETMWQQEGTPAGYFGALHFIDCDTITVLGKAQTYDVAAPRAKHLGSSPSATMLPTSPIDFVGGGYDWWWTVLLGPLDHRPHMIYMERCRSMVFLGLFMTDAPQFHMLAEDGADLYVKNMTIYVDVDRQRAMIEKAGFPSVTVSPPSHGSLKDEASPFPNSISIPTFPLNTDGIDPSVERSLIEDFSITNFDDAVAVKPCQQLGSTYCKCASDMIVRNGAVRWSVGLTIGSVPPRVEINCVRNITFDSIHMTLPLKQIYIKTNPGDEGSGIIDQITFSNVQGDMPVWYPIWIGPQQQKQPANGTDTGCSFFYPLNTTCATQPLVTISNVALINITAVKGLTLPGVILCDPVTPCTNLTFQAVDNTGPFLVQKDYVCKNAFGQQVDSQPALPCLDQAKEIAGGVAREDEDDRLALI